MTDGIATLTLAMPKVNKIDESFGHGLEDALAEAVGTEGLRGIIVASANRDFCVGADIDGLFAERDAAKMFRRVTELQFLFRSLETAGVPVVAALTGTALGGGLELALSCHRRIALNDPRVQLGLPEVNLGVLPGAGATIAAFLAYGVDRNLAKGKKKEEFGTGSLRGLAAPESANNAASSGSFVPLLTLGIPGSGT
ncbi:MAG: hypothetical protein GY873_01075, partial [Bosea sp.]|uniref:enoyl-CoA hydratase/isomerase family protein n=1 Tax=Bosea sp. (in: a-proteobacteria) TaxID=1871050 RepID=UPI00239CD9CF|nr:hypothetical protein [Bosea sp. (in: a-proteobacteria)]